MGVKGGQHRRNGGRGGLVTGLVGGTPFAGVGEQRGRRGVLRQCQAGPDPPGLEIPSAEGLQRVLGAALAQHLIGGLAGRRGRVGGHQVIAQLRHQHRGRLRAVVALAAPAPADRQHAPGREHGFEHQVTVIVAARAVARALLAGQAHQVEVIAPGLARVVAVVHADQAHHLEGDGAQRHQRAEGDAAGQEACAAASGRVAVGIERAQPGLTQHRQRHGGLKPGAVASGQPAGQRAVERGQRQPLTLIAGREPRRHQRPAALCPGRCRGVLAGQRPPGVQLLDQIDQGAQAVGLQPANVVKRRDAIEGRCRAAGITQQQAAQAKQPTVLLAAGPQAQAVALRRVQAPAHAGRRDPARQAGQRIGVQPQALRDGGHLQQIAKFTGGEALGIGAQQPFQGQQYRVAAPARQVGNLERDEAGVVAAVLAEHGANRRREQRNVGRHHHHVARCQRAILGCGGGPRQQLQQLVVQDLNLTLRAVADVEHDRAVLRVGRQRRVLGQRHQITHAGLQPGQQGVARAVVEQVDARQIDGALVSLRLIEGIQLAHEITALPTPGRQQRMGVVMHRRQRHAAQVLRTARSVPRAGRAQQLAAFEDVGPMETAGVGDRQNNLAAARQRGQGLQRLARQVRGAQQHHAAWQGCHRGLIARQSRQKIAVHLRPERAELRRRQLCQQQTPQRGLPALVRRQRAGLATRRDQLVTPLGPGSQPVGPVDLVLVEQIGQPRRQLQTAIRTAGLQKAGHRLKTRARRPIGQGAHQAPGQSIFLERRAGGHRSPPQHQPIAAPQETRRQLNPCGGAQAGMAGQGHLQPLGRAIALDQKVLSLQRCQRRAVQPIKHRLGQQLQPVAMQHQQPGPDLTRHRAALG